MTSLHLGPGTRSEQREVLLVTSRVGGALDMIHTVQTARQSHGSPDITHRFCKQIVKRVAPTGALASTANGKRRSAKQRGRIDVAIDAPRLLREADPE
jgi:hypothetical protein